MSNLYEIYIYLENLSRCGLQPASFLLAPYVLFIIEPQDDFFCFIPPSLAAKYGF